MPTKFCPHCGERSGFEVRFNIFYRIGDKEQGKGFLRICKMCGGRFITTPKDEGIKKRGKSIDTLSREERSSQEGKVPPNDQ